jgi:hypothetical protein
MLCRTSDKTLFITGSIKLLFFGPTSFYIPLLDRVVGCDHNPRMELLSMAWSRSGEETSDAAI